MFGGNKQIINLIQSMSHGSTYRQYCLSVLVSISVVILIPYLSLAICTKFYVSVCTAKTTHNCIHNKSGLPLQSMDGLHDLPESVI